MNVAPSARAEAVAAAPGGREPPCEVGGARPDDSGLTTSEARNRLLRDGPNRLLRGATRPVPDERGRQVEDADADDAAHDDRARFSTVARILGAAEGIRGSPGPR
jgi:hypothetical protein